MNALVTFRLCKLSDEDLLKKVNEGIDNLYIEDKIPTRHIPARPDSDFDLLVGELIMRFKERDTTLTTTPAFLLRTFDTGKYYWCKCEKCGWEDSSEFLEGCHPIADTGDYSDPYCPVCGSKDIEGEPTIDVPEYKGIVTVSIPIDVLLDPYKKTLKEIQDFHDKAYWDKLEAQIEQKEMALNISQKGEQC